ncbi:protein EFR3 homolog B isoform X2 [Parasteatoda tepidariorum]|uniref:protein EFR3 homolog B isoform X2 n=1 Tax=Parasteatoda tepidariorum TaxID=114398 RepID=UPI001C7214BB|nr:protein EFR3 homolog B isoform X2 [Parasteatoda tepidariorum]
MAGCCGCCSALRPRYRRLVDNIYPSDPQDGLVRNNMEKLTFYALSSPEKLDRIGEYLAWKVSRDIARHRHGFVIIAMEAMDQLLIACHAQTLNLFVESFLKMVQKLLECHEPDMQLLAAQSFVKFANIEEDTPSYHRRYDFFVSKFSSLCHFCHDDLDMQNRLRVAGLKGIQGVVRKTVSDDLQVNIWDDTHMEKIIPSLLFNMQGHCGGLTETPDSPQEESNPWSLAENCIRELMGRATFGNVPSVIRPVLKHLDNHELWDPNDFAVHTFKIIMYSIQVQYSYAVIQILMSHLDEKSRMDESEKKRRKPKADAKVRTGIVNVLANIVSIAAGESIGPSVLEIFNSLLNHLRHSIDVHSTKEKDLIDEKHFQDCVINTLGEFANNLPDFHKIEIMMFIMGKVPKVPLTAGESQEADVLLQKILLKSLLKVGTKYSTVQMSQAFPSAFLQPLLQMSLASDTSVRLVVQQILHTLLDRHDYLAILTKLCISGPLPEIKIEKCSRQDTMFFKKNGPDVLMHMYENVQLANNTAENFDAIYVTLALICVEFGTDSDVLIELIRLIFAIQDLPAKSSLLSSGQHCAMHILVAGFLYFLGQLTAIPLFCSHIDQIIKNRLEKAPQLLPDDSLTFGLFNSIPDNIDESLLFDKTIIAEALRNSGHDTTRLLTPYIPRRVGQVTVTRSVSDLNSISVEVDSVNSSPGIPRRHPEEEITVESLKRMLAESPTAKRQAEDERRLRVIEEFRTAAFEDLVAKAEQQTVDLQNKLNEIFGRSPAAVDISSRPNSPHPTSREGDRQTPLAPPVYNIKFPNHFIY